MESERIQNPGNIVHGFIMVKCLGSIRTSVLPVRGFGLVAVGLDKLPIAAGFLILNWGGTSAILSARWIPAVFQTRIP